MANQECIDKILAEADNKEELEAFAGRLKEARKRLLAEGKLENYEADMRKAAKELSGDAKVAADQARRHAAINIIVRDRVEKLRATATSQGMKEDEFLENLDVGSMKQVDGAMLSAASMTKSLSATWFQQWTEAMEAGGSNIQKRFNKPDFEENLSKEFRNPGSTNDADAAHAAKVFSDMYEMIRRELNTAGAFIGKLEGYHPQSHDVFAMKKTTQDKWVEHIHPLLDENTTFKNMDKDSQIEMLREVYLNIISGEKDIISGVEMGKHTSPSSLAKSLSKKRVLHFKDADAFNTYNNDFGIGTVSEGVTNWFDKAARDLSLMRTYGPNPEVMRASLKKQAQRAARGKQEEFNEDLVDGAFEVASGLDRIPGNPTGAKIMGSIRALMTTSHLVGAAVTAIGDVASSGVTAQINGKGFFSAYANAFKNLTGLPKELRENVLKYIPVGVDGAMGTTHARVTHLDATPGVMAKWTSNMFKWSGMNLITDNMKGGFGIMLSNMVADSLSKGFNQIDDGMLDTLKRYGISEKDWGLMQKASLRSADGKNYFTPESIQKLPSELFSSKPAKAKRLRDELEVKLMGVFIGEADFASPTPTARERNRLMKRTKPGTVYGEAVRAFLQYKSHPLNLMMRILPRIAQSKSGKQLLAQYIVVTTAMGYGAMSIKDVFRGKEVRDPLLPKTWAQAFAQGGGAALYGDFLMGEFNRYGQSFTGTFAGPLAGLIDNIASIFAATLRGEGGQAANKAWNTVAHNTPFINMWYSRWLVDHYIHHQVQEFINPGYLGRLRRGMREQNNQEFWFEPERLI